MFLEKNSRWFKRYQLTFAGRKRGATPLPLHRPGDWSVSDALQKRIDEEKALEVQANTDIVELMRVDFDDVNNCLVLLFHRASPNAADPMYRKKARAAVTTRQAAKSPGEEQAVSAHLLIDNAADSHGVHRAVLEEIPGLSMGVIQPIIGRAVNEYRYEYHDARRKKQDTVASFKPSGIKSESLTHALKKGRLNLITLSRQAKAGFVDADGMFQPTYEYMKIKIRGEIDADNWGSHMRNLAARAKEEGWDDFTLDIDLDNNRRKSVRLDREDEAKEILFVSAKRVEILGSALLPCSVNIEPRVVKAGRDLLKNDS